MEKFLQYEVISNILAAKLLGRAIDSVKRGFDKDTELPSQLNCYRAIQELYPDSTVTVREMFESMDKRANKKESRVIPGLNSPAALALWNEGTGVKESEKILAAIPKVITLLLAAEPKPSSWHDLSAVAQWAILSSVERSLPEKETFYRSSGGANFLRLADECHATSQPFFDLITEFLDENEAELTRARLDGINVPLRQTA